jgi:hypothetical protein
LFRFDNTPLANNKEFLGLWKSSNKNKFWKGWTTIASC